MSSTLSQTHTMVVDASKPSIEPEDALEDQTITAENLQKLFPGTLKYLQQPEPDTVSTEDKELQGADAKQASYMKEVCIVLDEDDKPIGGGSKKICASLSSSVEASESILQCYNADTSCPF